MVKRSGAVESDGRGRVGKLGALTGQSFTFMRIGKSYTSAIGLPCFYHHGS